MESNAETISLLHDWKSPRDVELPIIAAPDFDIVERLVAKGFLSLDFGLPFGVFRLPIQDDAQWILDCLVELESDDCLQTGVDCILADSGIQIGFRLDREMVVARFLILPCLDQRFAIRMNIEFERITLLTIWRGMARKLWNVAGVIV